MTNTRRLPLNRILFAFLAAPMFLAGCGYWDEPTPPGYTRVTTAISNVGEPFGIAVREDEVYFSNGETGTIAKLESDGAATVIARGLNTPSGIAFLPDGDLVVADTGSHTIRRVSLDGTVSLFAGVENATGTDDGKHSEAKFNGPVGIAADDKGNVYVADTYNDRIRMIQTGGVVSTIAGSSRGFADGPSQEAKFDTPLGVAILGDKILVADSGNQRIRVVEPGSGVWTLAGHGGSDQPDGTLASSSFLSPSAITVGSGGEVFVADGNAIRVIGRRLFPMVETLTGDSRGFENGTSRLARFNRPSGLALGSDKALFIADSDNRAIRVLSDADTPNLDTAPAEPELPLATRWPFDPPNALREVAGTMGEIRGEIGPSNKPSWFHNGLDIAGAYGETAVFLRDETVLDPQSADNFGTSRELLRLPLLGYIHLRLGRDKDDRPFPDPRFQFDRDPSGKLIDIRIRRGTKFSAGDSIGTLNAMNHVHLIAGRQGHEINAFAALTLPGVGDSIPPVIEDVSFFTPEWSLIEPRKLAEKTRIVVRAYDRMDGNSERRRLGVHRVGYQVFSNGAPLGGIQWTIRFDRMPSNDAVRFAYAENSQSGYTGQTIFNYIATNRIDGDEYREDFLNLPIGSHTLRVFAADYFGNVVSRDIEVVRP